MSSAAKAECGIIHINTREAVPMSILLEEIDHPQPKSFIQTDNTNTLEVPFCFPRSVKILNF